MHRFIKLSIICTLFILFFFLQNTYAWAAEYFVSPSGNDSNAGTLSGPWRTLAKAAGSATAGDTVYLMSGTYKERLVPAFSGTSNNYLTFSAYTGHTPVIDGSNVQVGNFQGLVDLSNKSYIRISGITVQNSAYAGIFSGGKSTGLIIEKNKTINSISSGIAVWGGANILIDGNDVLDSNLGPNHEALDVAGGTDGFEIRYNKVHNDNGLGKEGIDVKEGVRNGLIHHNEVYNTKAIAIYVDAFDLETYNIKVFDNLVHHGSNGIAIASEHGGFLHDIAVYNNIIYNMNNIAIRAFGLVESAYTTHPMNNILIMNNTIYNSSNGITNANDQVSGYFIIRNNIIFNAGQVYSNNSNIISDHNLYVDPGFVNAQAFDFHLLEGSQAVDAGSSEYAPEDDFECNKRPALNGFDIGAYEYGAIITQGGNCGIISSIFNTAGNNNTNGNTLSPTSIFAFNPPAKPSPLPTAMPTSNYYPDLAIFILLIPLILFILRSLI